MITKIYSDSTKNTQQLLHAISSDSIEFIERQLAQDQEEIKQLLDEFNLCISESKHN